MAATSKPGTGVGKGVRVDKIAKMLIGVENLVVQGVAYDEERDCIVISARPTLPHARECGKCGRKAPVYDAGRGRRRWRCMDLGGIRCYVESEADRVACPECGVTVRKFPWAAHGSCFTYAFEDTCCPHALNMSKSACAKLMRVEWRTVGDICARVLARLESGRPPRCEGLIRIGIDETSYKKGHKYLTVVVNHDTGAVVWCAAGHGRQVADAFFSGLTPEQRAGIELVSADGARWIADAPAHWAPQAKRCVDPFHVVGWASEALDEVRKQAWREAKAQVKAQCRAGAEVKAKAGSGSRSRAKGLAQRDRGRPKADEEAHAEKQAQAARAVKGLRYPLLKNPESLTPRQAAALELAAISNPRLYRAYLLKEELRLALKLPAEQLREAVAVWSGKAWRSRIPEFVELQRKIRRHMEAIVATAENGLTNARVEAINNKIKLTVKMAYGFRNVDSLMAMVMLRCSGLSIELPGRAKKEERKAA